jgi:hypothetical protein
VDQADDKRVVEGTCGFTDHAESVAHEPLLVSNQIKGMDLRELEVGSE